MQRTTTALATACAVAFVLTGCSTVDQSPVATTSGPSIAPAPETNQATQVGAEDQNRSKVDPSRVLGEVLEVVDGNTLRIHVDQEEYFEGLYGNGTDQNVPADYELTVTTPVMDVPEPGQCGAEESKQALEDLLADTIRSGHPFIRVEMIDPARGMVSTEPGEFDPPRLNEAGETLMMFSIPLPVEERMLAAGQGRYGSLLPTPEQAAESQRQGFQDFEDYQNAAKRDGKGFWVACGAS